MQTLERIVFIIVAIIVFGIILNFSLTYDYVSLFDRTDKDVRGDIQAIQFDEHTYVRYIHEVWKDCGYGEVLYNRTYIAQFEDDSLVINYTDFIEDARELHYCGDIIDLDPPYNCGRVGSRSLADRSFTFRDGHVYIVFCQAGSLYINDLMGTS